MVTAKSN